ncbi:MAG: TIGR00304 family membrane protein [Thermoplasmata archaeon]
MLYFTQYSEKLEDMDKINTDDLKSSVTGVVFLGPFPIVISNDKRVKKYLIYIFVVGIVLFIVTTLIFFGF